MKFWVDYRSAKLIEADSAEREQRKSFLIHLRLMNIIRRYILYKKQIKMLNMQ